MFASCLSKVEDDPALLGKKAGKGLFSGFGFGVKSSDSQVVKNENVNAADIMVDRPAGMEGFLEKKAKGKVSNEWQKKYFKIDEKSSTLFYYKSKKFVPLIYDLIYDFSSLC